MARTPVVWVAVGSGNPCKVEAVRSAFLSLYAAAASSPKVEIVVTSHPDVGSGVANQPYGDAETKLGAVNRANAAWEDAIRSRPSIIEAKGIEKAAPDFAVGLEGGVEKAPASTAGIMTAARSGGRSNTATSRSSSTHCGDERSDYVTGDEKEQAQVLWCMAWMAVRGTGSPICTMAKAEDSPYNVKPPNGIDSAVPVFFKEVWGFGRTGSFELPPAVAKLVNEEGMELGDADDKIFRRVKSKHGSGTVGILTNGMIDRSSYYDHALKLALVPWVRPELYSD